MAFLARCSLALWCAGALALTLSERAERECSGSIYATLFPPLPVPSHRPRPAALLPPTSQPTPLPPAPTGHTSCDFMASSALVHICIHII